MGKKSVEPYISGKIDYVVSKIYNKFPLIDNVYITKVMYNNPATIVFWSDGTKTISKCHERDTFNKETGLAICIMKKIIGTEETRFIFKDWTIKDDVVTLSDIRKEKRRTAK